MSRGWRYYAANALTKDFIHTDLPLNNVQITRTLNGPTSIRAEIDSSWDGLRDSSGNPLLQEWGTIILAEKNGQIRAGGILVNSDFDGPKWTLDVKGFTAYPQGQILERPYTYTDTGSDADGVDPITVVKWLYGNEGLGYFEDARLGVTFNNVASKYRLGTWTYVQTTTVKVKGKDTKQKVTLTKDINGVDVERPSGVTKATYALSQYDNIDVGQKIDEYAKQTPFDYVEYYGWSDDTHDHFVQRLDFGYPRLGTKRNDLRFAEGENITELVSVKSNGEDFVNSVRVIGSGEGKDQKSVTVGNRDGRLRRMALHTDQTLKTDETLTATGWDIFNAKHHLIDIAAITIDANHPNAPMGSFDVGDDIYVETFIGWQKLGLWVRVTELNYDTSEETLSLTTARSDSFRYVPGGTQ